MIKVLLDTNICIYLIKNHPQSVRRHFAEYVVGEIGIPAITVAELEYGVSKSNNPVRAQAALAQFLNPLSVVGFDMDAAMQYGTIRAYLEAQGTPIGPLDMLIAATALAHDCTLVSNNLREFLRVPNLRCDNWVAD